jgi:opacity protein-like surface antigen
MHFSRRTAFGIALVSAVAVAGVAAPASAQSFGVGPRVSFVRGDATTDSSSSSTPAAERLIGVMARIHASKRIAVEVAIDTRSETSADGSSRLRERPMQFTMLMYPLRTTFSPYILAGFGIYKQYVDTLDSTGTATATTSSQTTGWHAGFGAELTFHRHVAFYADYRWRNVSVGGTGAAGSSPIPGVNLFHVSSQGSMWTGGMAFYF